LLGGTEGQGDLCAYAALEGQLPPVFLLEGGEVVCLGLRGIENLQTHIDHLAEYLAVVVAEPNRVG